MTSLLLSLQYRLHSSHLRVFFVRSLLDHHQQVAVAERCPRVVNKGHWRSVKGNGFLDGWMDGLCLCFVTAVGETPIRTQTTIGCLLRIWDGHQTNLLYYYIDMCMSYCNFLFESRVCPVTATPSKGTPSHATPWHLHAPCRTEDSDGKRFMKIH